MFNVFIVDSAEAQHVSDAAIESEALRGCADVQLLVLNSESDFLPYAGRADGIILWHHLHLGAALIERLSRTRIVVRTGVGYDNVDIAAAAARGIPVSNVPDYGTEEVADHAIALALALVRQLKPLMQGASRGVWEWRAAAACRRVRELVFGVVGCGRIGTAAAVRAKALGFQTCFFDPYLPSGYEKAIGVARRESLNELLQAADIVSIHTPLTPETHRMISAPQFDLMKPSAFLINTARGAVVSHDALLEALSAKRIAGAGLDVLEREPEGSQDISRFPNAIVTPHSAFYSQESMVELRRKAALTVRDALLHGVLRNVVNQPLSPAAQ
ncbi:MAG TPA: C-terminal binding protein [Bryobacteraceae bacterium]|nr:C-terminal binding protein [Bryobacteraceae bacterium]